jgi:CDP-paratose 2-epimerase
MAKFLITGGAGFVGSHLAARLLAGGEHVTVLDNFSRVGTVANAAWLQELAASSPGTLDMLKADTRDAERVTAIFRELQPDALAHLAGQVAMTSSVADPRADFETNVTGTLNILEAVRRHSPESVVVYASSNKVYGNLAHLRLRETPLRYTPAADAPLEVDELAPLEFHTPYGCSKGAADQYVLDYARSFGLRTVVLRHSTIYGGKQHATFDQGWVGWFCKQAVEARETKTHQDETQQAPSRQPFTISGDGKQVRDLLHVDDAVAVYLAAYMHAEMARGEAFNIGGGAANSLSLLELFAWLEGQLDLKLRYRELPWRMSDQKYFVADTAKAARILGWSPKISLAHGLRDTLEVALTSANLA